MLAGASRTHPAPSATWAAAARLFEGLMAFFNSRPSPTSRGAALPVYKGGEVGCPKRFARVRPGRGRRSNLAVEVHTKTNSTAAAALPLASAMTIEAMLSLSLPRSRGGGKLSLSCCAVLRRTAPHRAWRCHVMQCPLCQACMHGPKAKCIPRCHSCVSSPSASSASPDRKATMCRCLAGLLAAGGGETSTGRSCSSKAARRHCGRTHA